MARHNHRQEIKSVVADVSDKWLAIGLLVLTVASLLLHFVPLGLPPETVFDEVHFGKFTSAYFTGEYYFDIHPPLGKLLIGLGAWLGGYADYVREFGVFDFKNIGAPYGQVPYGWMRLFPALAGSLIPLAVFGFMRSIGLGRRVSLIVMFCLVFENALLVHTKFILLDAFLLLFGFLGLTLFFTARSRGYALFLLIGAGIFFALSFSVKWTGLSFWALAGLVMFYDFVLARKHYMVSRWQFIFKGFAAMIFVPAVVYYLVFVIHFSLLPNNGPGMAYMSKLFRSGSLSLPEKFRELNLSMMFYNATLKATHTYGSPAWTWPVLARPIFYWHKQIDTGLASRIYLLGNPFVWWAAAIGVLGFIVFLKNIVSLDPFTKTLLLVGYVSNFIPFFSVSRVLFLYHYFSAFIFSLIIAAVLLENYLSRIKPNTRRLVLAAGALLVLVFFVFFAPLSFGLPMADSWYKLHTWLPSWV